MTPITKAKRGVFLCLIFVIGELGVLFIGLALAAFLGFSTTVHVWAVPFAAIAGLVLLVVACALIFITNLSD